MAAAYKSIFDTPWRRKNVGEGVWLGRNWHTLSMPIWSRARTSSIFFDADTLPEPVGGILTFSVFNASPETPKFLRVESPGHATVEAIIESSSRQSLLVYSPVQTLSAVETCGATEMSLTLNEIGNPVHLGHSADERWLGLSFHKFSPVPWYDKPLSYLDFTRNEICDLCLATGWASPEIEAGGVWSVGARATLNLPGCLINPAPEMAFDVAVLPRHDTLNLPPLQVEVHVNGELMTTRRFEAGSGSLIDCPMPENWTKGTELHVVFVFDELRSPFELGINEDNRALGILLRGLGPAMVLTSRSDVSRIDEIDEFSNEN